MKLRGGRWSASELERLTRLYGRYTASETAQRLNRSLQSVYHKASALGLMKKGGGFRRAEEALALRAKGLTSKEIARRMRLKKQSVDYYLYLARHPEEYEKLKKAMRKAD